MPEARHCSGEAAYTSTLTQAQELEWGYQGGQVAVWDGRRHMVLRR